ncbi:MAG: GGDEF domain-containing protein [Candidatus Thiodiazotropha sp.]
MTSGQPDPKLLNRLLQINQASYVIVTAVAALVLIAWLIPPAGHLLPDGWDLMKANTALSILLTVGAMTIAKPNCSAKSLVASRLLCLVILTLSVSALLGHLTDVVSPIDTLLAKDAQSDMPGRMSLQTASFFTLLSLILLSEPLGRETRARLSDLLTLALTLLTLVVLSAYLFGATNLYGQSPQTLTSPHTLLCMALLTYAKLVRRIHMGPFSVLVSVGIGGHIARLIAPWIVIVPFLVVGFGANLVDSGWMSIPQSSSLTVSLSIIGFLVVVLVLARKINQLENDLRQSSLTDELTQLHNRRGFYLLGEHLFYECLREEAPMSLLFFDLDGLKQVNDTLGHEIGSQLLCDFAALLKHNFRQSDVVARLGGDEFAVAAKQADLSLALARLQKAVEQTNSQTNRRYRISYSTGEVSEHPTADHTFDELLDQADALMYKEKREKKRKQGQTAG